MYSQLKMKCVAKPLSSFVHHCSVKECELLSTFEEKSIIPLPILMLCGNISINVRQRALLGRLQIK